eukprot:358951-Chlamydomonas_euryale.AAC.3
MEWNGISDNKQLKPAGSSPERGKNGMDRAVGFASVAGRPVVHLCFLAVRSFSVSEGALSAVGSARHDLPSDRAAPSPRNVFTAADRCGPAHLVERLLSKLGPQLTLKSM